MLLLHRANPAQDETAPLLNPGKYVQLLSILVNVVLRTSLITTAPGSAYIETSSPATRLVVSIHGPKPLPPSTPYTPTIQLTISFSLPLFSGRHHPRNPPGPATQLERFLAIRLEKLVGPMLLGHLFPKSGIDVNIGVLEYTGRWSLLAIATNAVSTAIAESGIDVMDLVSASSFAVTEDGLVVDPTGEEEETATAGGVVGYMTSTGEITDMWISGPLEVGDEEDMDVDSGRAVRLPEVMEKVVSAAADARLVINHALMEMVKEKGLAAKETNKS